MRGRKQVRVLVINPQTRIYESLLEHVEMNEHLFDVQCRYTASCDEAADLLLDWRPSVVLLDAHVSEGNSFEFLDEFGKTVAPIVVTSASNSLEIEHSANKRGAPYCECNELDPDQIGLLLYRLVELADEAVTH